MRFLHWLKGDPDRGRARERPRRKPEEDEKPKGDFRGSYGFGRRAHLPDPQGQYVFDNETIRRRSDPETR